MNQIWDKWKNHYAKSNINPESICKDGILNLDKFKNTKPRVLFIMKEANEFESGDLRELLKNGPRYQMWHTVARWAAGLLNDFPKYEEIDNANSMKDALLKIATINLKKKSGKESVIWSQINAYAHNDRDLLIEQIEEIKPNIVVACGTFEILIWLLNLKVNPDNPDEMPIYDTHRKAWVIPFRHPARINNENEYNKLKDMYKVIPLQYLKST